MSLQARAPSPCTAADSARCNAASACSTSTRASAGKATRTLPRPASTSVPTAARSFRQEHSQRRGMVGRLLAGPDRLDELVAADGARPLQHEVREKDATLPAGKAL